MTGLNGEQCAQNSLKECGNRRGNPLLQQIAPMSIGRQQRQSSFTWWDHQDIKKRKTSFEAGDSKFVICILGLPKERTSQAYVQRQKGFHVLVWLQMDEMLRWVLQNEILSVKLPINRRAISRLSRIGKWDVNNCFISADEWLFTSTISFTLPMSFNFENDFLLGAALRR